MNSDLILTFITTAIFGLAGIIIALRFFGGGV